MSAFGGMSNLTNGNGFDFKSNQNGFNPKFNNGFSDPRRSGQGNKSTNNSNNNQSNRANGTASSNNNRGNRQGNSNNNGAKGQQRKKQPQQQSQPLKTERNNRTESPMPMPVEDDPLDIPTTVIPRQSQLQYQNYSSNEISLTGNLFNSPQDLNQFKRIPQKNIRPRPIPKYLLIQPRLLHTPTFQQNAWDQQNQAKMREMELSNGGKDYQGLYEEFQKMREIERKQMEQLGLVDAENISKDLNDAISFQGTCLDMCPVFERVRRALENNVKALERDPISKKIAPERAVKAFSRPAAGQPPPLPSEVRPPHVLKQSLNYLVDTVLDQLPEAHSFIWDRTRSIRQDFTYQNSFGPEAIECNERIVRIHLLSLHVMAGSDVEYSQQQELEQFNKAMQTLIEIYRDVRNNGGSCPNEAEFRAYHLLSHLRDPELEREVQNLPSHIFQDPKLQLAIRLRHIISQNNIAERGVANTIGAVNLFAEFFQVVFDSSTTPFLMACLLETHFNEIRFYALKAMVRCYHSKGKAYSADALKSILGFDSVEKLIKFVTYYEIDTMEEDGEIKVDLFNKEKLETKYKLNSAQDKAKFTPSYSRQLVMNGSYRDIINSGNDSVVGLNPDQVNSFQKVLPPPSQTVKSFGQSSFGQFGQPLSQPFGQPQQAKLPPITKQEPAFSFAPTIVKEPVSTPSVNTPPAFSFDPPAQQPQAQAPPQQPIPPVEKSTFGFSKPQSVASITPSFNKPIKEIKTTPLKFEIKPSTPSPLAIPTKLQEIKSIPEFKKEEIVVKKPTIIPPPAAPKKIKLTDHPQFGLALKQITDEIFNESIVLELKALLPKLSHLHNLKKEHGKVIQTLSNELYNAFLSEIIYQEIMNATADFQFKKSLQKRMIQKLNVIGGKLIKKREIRQKKLQELKSVQFKVPQIKRPKSSSDTSMTQRSKKIKVSNTSIMEKQNKVNELWSPIDLNQFVNNCTNNVKISIENENLNLKFLLIVENWSSPYSKWLNTKLSLKPNQVEKTYQNIITNNKITLNLLSLPGQDYLSKDFFSTTSFILFECGLTGDSNGISIEEKLKKDRLVLEKIISLVDKFSYYKVQVLVVYWDASSSGSIVDVIDLLGLSSFESDKKNVSSIVFCDMTVEDGNISNILNNAFKDLSKKFTLELTSRGTKKLDRINRKKKPLLIEKPIEIPKLIEEIKETENNLLEKAKRTRRFEYLNNHLNTSKSSIHLKPTTRHKFDNSTFVENNTTMLSNMTTNNINVSTLLGFGKGFMEESTPASSPNSKRTYDVTDEYSKPLPKNVQQLRELTAGIKSKYRKKQT
ncbi:SAC3/GANP/Nin1/mts3/eIF-3 p25 family-domain-containing protein [Scheffersomyces coipomensis]|uniref:SAC3/GANP/Nin1/mts3/eIF-3 p25 family-domain-containing protein n=1 Tax=Scheffersomyces coipomensis TaxID=1788519 RepID=UPI00315CBDA6